ALAACKLQRAVETVPRRGQPDAERRRIGNQRQRQAQQQENRRIGIVIEADVRTGDRALERVEGGKVIDFLRAAMQRQKGGGPIIDEIISERAVNAVAEAVPRLRQEISDVEGGGKEDPVLRDQPEPRAIRQETHKALPQRSFQGSLCRVIDRRHARAPATCVPRAPTWGQRLSAWLIVAGFWPPGTTARCIRATVPRKGDELRVCTIAPPWHHPNNQRTNMLG